MAPRALPVASMTLALADLRRHVIAAQGFEARHRRATPESVAAAAGRLSCVQLDSIATVDRSHRLVLGARVGKLPAGVETRLLSSGRLFEYWAHEASLLPVEDWPLFTHRMRERQVHHWFGPVIARDPTLAQHVLERIRREGPLPSRAFEGKGKGGMWNWKPAKRMLDALWTAGALVIAAREGFERQYDLPERVIPKDVLEQEPPDERAATEALILRAVEARGALTLAGIADHYRLGAQRDVRPHAERLVAEGQLRHEAVDDDGPDVYLLPDAAPEDAPAPRGAFLLSPFENMLWDRAFVRRAWDFDHTMEIYKPAPQRVYGYYVMPFLRGDRLAGRADVKADRAAGKLLVRKWHWEAPPPSRADEEEALRALARLARQLGLEAPERLPQRRAAGRR